MSEKIQSLLKKLPKMPGVYKLKSEDGSVLYVGKAKDLRARVRTYFRKEKGRSMRLKKLLEKTADLEWTEVGSDLEAIVLESNLIKELRPKYNVLLKDDKNFVYIKITKNEDYPMVKIVRRVEKDGARYFGPKTAAGKVKKTLLLLQKLFKYRSCDLGIEWKGEGLVKITKKNIAYPCLDFHIKRCEAPCIGNISPEEYAEGILQIELFLEGKTEEIEANLKKRMEELVAGKEFEKASLIRDRLLAIQELSEKQLVSSPDHKNMDVFGFVVDGTKAYFNLFMFRDGKLVNQENFVADAGAYSEDDASGLLGSFLYQYYEKAADVPRQIFLPLKLEDDGFFEDWVKAKIVVPQKGKKNKLIELSHKNAESFMKQHKARFEVASRDDSKALAELEEVLGLKSAKRIEAYDISHLGGSDTVASMVVFEKGVPKKSDYRKFRMRSIADGEVDDYKSMTEVLRRRLGRMRKDIRIRQAEKGKKKDILTFLKNGWDQDEMFGEFGEYYVAYTGKMSVGMVRMIPGGGDLYLMEVLYVDPKFRHKGIGRALMTYAIEKSKAKRVYLYAFDKMVDYYKEYGFEEVKKMPECFIERVANFKKRNPQNVTFFAYNPGKNKDASFAAKPGLLLIDGGRGQLKVAVEVLKNYDLDIPVISLAKREEEVFVPGQKTSLLIDKESPAVLLLRRVRDEAHRFAITFQKNRRKKAMFK